jgi:hypothetical protein
MAQNEIHENDIGTVFEVTLKDGATVIDISGATEKKIKFRKPDKTTFEKDMDFVTDGTNGQLKYETEDGDMSQPGNWAMQVYIESTTWTGHSEMHAFTVHETIKVEVGP